MLITVMEWEDKILIQCPVKGSAFIMSEKAGSVGSRDGIFVYVVGKKLAEVGSSYLNLARVLNVLSKIQPGRDQSLALNEYHPLFNAQGDLVATYGTKTTLKV